MSNSPIRRTMGMMPVVEVVVERGMFLSIDSMTKAVSGWSISGPSLMISILLALSPASSLAASPTTSAAERAQQLAKMEAELNSDDPNERLSALEFAMENGTGAQRQRALSIAFASSDFDMRSMALKYAICASPNLVMKYPRSQTGSGVFEAIYEPLVPGTTALALTRCDPTNGTFDVELAGRGERRISGGRISGLNLEMAFGGSSPRVFRCSASFSLAADMRLTGQFSCSSEGYPYPATEATIVLR